MQEKLDALRLPEEEISQVEHPVLLVHGREDVIVPVDCSIRGNKLLKNSDLHIYSNCGHWSQFERAAEFGALVHNFLSQADQ